MCSLSRTVRWLLSAGLLLLAGCGARPALLDLGPVPAFELTGEDGQPFASAARLQGRVWVADFIYTECPGPCPRMTQYMKRIQDGGLGELQLVSFTVDPERDTPPVLAAYARRFGADAARWHFLTGPREALRALAKDGFRLGDVAPDLEHSTRFALVDKRGRIRGYYGTASEPGSALAQLQADAKALLKE